MKINTINELFTGLKSGKIDLNDNLPNFGGEAPPDTTGIWSWSADALIVGSCVYDLELQSRERDEDGFRQTLAR